MDTPEQTPQTPEPEESKDEVIPVTFLKMNQHGMTIHVLSDQKKYVGESVFTRTMCGLVTHRSSLYLPPTSERPERLCTVCAKRSGLGS